MTRAKEITRVNHTATRVRRAAQKACAGMTRDHRKNLDVFMFTDGSAIVVTGQLVRIAELPF